mgnify:CR=1 FL=1
MLKGQDVVVLAQLGRRGDLPHGARKAVGRAGKGDRTTQRPSTFFGKGIVAHVSLAEPFCRDTSRTLAQAAASSGATSNGAATGGAATNGAATGGPATNGAPTNGTGVRAPADMARTNGRSAYDRPVRRPTPSHVRR